ncbi:MAG: FtsW/RodA/SpoVE family cell cycle protein [Bacilli bacterium]|nr:FtsW/RodA/SpoVE family cell cycle protein [Bacilli bacterium]
MKTDKINLKIIISLFIIMIISILSIYATHNFLKIELHNLYLKQLLFYILGSVIILFTTFKGFNYLKKYHLLIYIGINILLLFLLIFGIEINGSKCWIYLGSISFQPSELMKISLIISLACIISEYNKNKEKNTKNEFILLLKLLILTLIPSILTFLEPDTGVVIIYLLIFITFLFFIKLNKVWYITFLSVFLIIFGSIITLYFFKQDLFISIVGYDIFYRIDRVLNWFNMSGYQLENSLIAIGASGTLGFGYLQNTVYFPEPQTDFIFTTYTSNFGLIGAYFLLFILVIFDTSILKLANKKIKLVDKYIILGIFIMILYGQIQNIGMTIGLLPITGIPLPFISYGGTSLLVFLFIIGIILNINRESKKYRN